MTSSYFLYDPKSMQSPAAFAMAERMNGIFSPLEILPEAFTKAYELPIGEHVEKNYKGLSYLSWTTGGQYRRHSWHTLAAWSNP